ncbi:hypothetical protein ES707_12972 [subsurface metagenome]
MSRMYSSMERIKNKLSPGLITGIMLAIFFAVALFIRVYFPYDRIFAGDWIKYAGIDVYHHMRLVDIIVHNFPHSPTFDPYLIFPGGAGVGGFQLFHWLLAGIIWVIGLGAPAEHTIDVVGIYFPAVLGALTVIPVYFIGKELFGRWVGVISAALIAVLPGEFLGRSILGFTDHDVLNTLLTTVALLFLVLAVKAAGEKQFNFGHLKRWDWATSAKPVIYSLLAGVALGAYLLTWAGGLLFVFIITIYFIVQFIINHLRQKSTDYLCLVGVIIFFIALVVFWPTSPTNLERASLIIALFIPLVLSGISWLMVKKKVRPGYYPLTLVVPAVLGIIYIFCAVKFSLFGASLFSSMLGAFSIFNPTAMDLTTIEMQPFFGAINGNSFALAWGNFTTSFFIICAFFAGLIIYAIFKRGGAGRLWRVIREAGDDKTILVVWSLVILLAVIGQRRFASYLVVNVALLTGYLSWKILGLVGFKELGAGIVKTVGEASRKKVRPKKDGFRITVSQANKTLAVLIIFLVVFAPNVLFPTPAKSPTISTARAVRYAPSDAWVSSLSWMRENTPDPFDNPDAYYQLGTSGKYASLTSLMRFYPNPTGDPDYYYQLGSSYPYPESAYGVMAWWDYGYWITRIARRIPNANPGQDPRAVADVASFFISQDEQSASEVMQELGSAYVVIDYETALGKFWAIVTRAGGSPPDYFDVYLVTTLKILPPGDSLMSR